MHYTAMHIGEPKIASLKAVGEAAVIDTRAMKLRRISIANREAAADGCQDQHNY